MASISSTIICTRCKQKVSLNNVRYALNGKDLMCVPCVQLPMQKPQKSTADREKYHCLQCNYKFSIRKDSKLSRRCPFCASENITLPEIFTAETVLADVTARPEPAYPR